MCERARSFERDAAAYERHRPEYPADAVAWLAARLGIARGRHVLDLGAGTGKLTRALAATGAVVVAVDPAAAMLEQLRAVAPGVEALVGTAEAIPLPDRSVDAVTVAQAFHWFHPEAAPRELHRVLRPGGGVGVVWNGWDTSDPLQARIFDLTLGPAREGERSRLALPASGLFGPLDSARFESVWETTPDLLAARVATSSAMLTAAPGAREAALAEIHAAAAARGERLVLRQVTEASVCFRL